MHTKPSLSVARRLFLTALAVFMLWSMWSTLFWMLIVVALFQSVFFFMKRPINFQVQLFLQTTLTSIHQTMAYCLFINHEEPMLLGMLADWIGLKSKKTR